MSGSLDGGAYFCHSAPQATLDYYAIAAGFDAELSQESKSLAVDP
jgi:hypothetical protein